MSSISASPVTVTVNSVDELLGAEMVIVIADAEAGRSVRRKIAASRF